MLEQSVISEGLILTVIGIGTAFGLLFLMMLVIMGMGRTIAAVEGRLSIGWFRATTTSKVSDRDKALVAAIAVSAVQSQKAGKGKVSRDDSYV